MIWKLKEKMDNNSKALTAEIINEKMNSFPHSDVSNNMRTRIVDVENIYFCIICQQICFGFEDYKIHFSNKHKLLHY